jgi:CubicO group peptidase (beta-lactamase class C family)
MVRDPGSEFQYDSGAPILTSAILKQCAGVHADVYAERYLFGPLGIKQVKWIRNDEGHPHTGGGLDLLPRDMAKFGLLYLRGGRWGDRQVVPEEWVKESFRQRVSFDERGPTTGYGYWWWISEPDPSGAGDTSIFSARGFRAQYIFVIPEHDMVVVVTGGTRRGIDQRKPIEFLYSHILPSVSREAP